MAKVVSTRHPEYSQRFADWVLMRDSYKGERQVKSKSTVYLPATSGHIADGYDKGTTTAGFKAYEAYKLRARYPNFVREAVQAAIGMMHSQPAEISVPKALENVVSSLGEDMHTLLRRINTEQLLTGRVGLMVDIPTAGPDNPYIALYSTERIINWDNGTVEGLSPNKLNLVVIDETEYIRRNDFTWETKEKYRVLSLGPVHTNEANGVYLQGIFIEADYSDLQMKQISWKGRTLDQIPFEFVNSCDVLPATDDPPLLDLANMCMTIYRSEADYRQNLFMQGQDTFVTTGANIEAGDQVRVGAGARLDLPQGATAEYVGVQSSGLSEQREALRNLEQRAGSMGAQTLDSTSRERESGASMQIRVAARTADLNQIADAGAKALENSLKMIAKWIGEDPTSIKITPNKEFGEASLSGQTMTELATAAGRPFPLSAKSMHDLARKRRVTSLTFEEEEAQAKKEDESESPFSKPKPIETDPAGGPPDDNGGVKPDA